MTTRRGWEGRDEGAAPYEGAQGSDYQRRGGKSSPGTVSCSLVGLRWGLIGIGGLLGVGMDPVIGLGELGQTSPEVIRDTVPPPDEPMM